MTVMSKLLPYRQHASTPRIPTILVFLSLLVQFTSSASSDEEKNDLGSELSNSFISDIAPLISLFGEQVTKQFMSQSMYWYDHIIFSMAPLGIITAIVGAIRVGGPAWLRALIGRARESRGVGEMELMTSTSTDVCELWNSRQVVRVMGTAKIEQILVFPKLLVEMEGGGVEGTIEEAGGEAGERTWGLYTVAEARERGILVQKDSTSLIDRFLSKIMSHRKTNSNGIEEVGNTRIIRSPITLSDHPHTARNLQRGKKCAPNITLNCANPDNNHFKLQLQIVSLIGVVLQLGVIVIDILLEKSPKLKSKLTGPFSQSGVWITVAGTVMLVIGMLLCSYIIETSTKEILWAVKDEERYGKFFVVWVQRGQTVNDQHFDSYAVFAKELRGSVMTSNPNQRGYFLDEDEFKSSTSPQGNVIPGGRGRGDASTPTSIGPSTSPPRGSNSPSAAPNERTRRDLKKDRYTDDIHQDSFKSMENLVLAATVCSLVGFFVQLIGLRGMNWVATVAQLGATLIMTALRSWIRRDLKDPRGPFAHQLPQDFELDWLATRLANCVSGNGEGFEVLWERIRLEEERRNGVHVKKKKNGDEATSTTTLNEKDGHDKFGDAWAMFWGQSAIGWDIVTPIKKNVRSTQSADTDVSSSPSSLPQIVDRYVAIRKRLGHLTAWESPAASIANDICKATESVLSALDASGTILKGADIQSRSARGYFKWPLVVEADHIPQETHLRLTFHMKKRRWVADARDVEAVLSLWMYALNDAHWGAEEEMVFLFGKSDVGSLRDLCWWIDDLANPIQEVTVLDRPPDRIEWDVPMDDRVYFGYCGEDIFEEPFFSQLSRIRFCKAEMIFDEYEITERLPKSNNIKPKQALAIRTTSSTTEICGMHLFWSFLLAVGSAIDLATTLGRIEDQTTLQYRGIQYRTIGNSDEYVAPWYSLKLYNPVLSRLAESVQEVGICTREEAQLMIILGLGVKGKLPKSKAVIRWAREQIASHTQADNYDSAADIVFWLYRACGTYGWTHEIALDALATFSEFFRIVSNEAAWEVRHEAASMRELEAELWGNNTFQPNRFTVLQTRMRETLQKDFDAEGGAQLKAIMDLLNRVSSLDGRLAPWHAEDLLRGSDADTHMRYHDGDMSVEGEYARKQSDLREAMERAGVPYVVGWLSEWHELTAYLRKEVDTSSSDQIDGPGSNLIGIYNFGTFSSRLQAWAEAAPEAGREFSRLFVPDIFGRTLLHYVCADPDLSAIIIIKGAPALDVNARDISGLTPMHFAAWSHNAEAISALLAAGARPSYRNNQGQTPLHILAAGAGGPAKRADHYFQCGKTWTIHPKQAMETLLGQPGVDVDAPDSRLQTPLHLAARSGTPLAIHSLIAAGASTSAQTLGIGRTPLHLLCLRTELAGDPGWRCDPVMELVRAAAPTAEEAETLLDLKETGTHITLGRKAASVGNVSILEALLRIAHSGGRCPRSAKGDCAWYANRHDLHARTPVMSWAAAARHYRIVEMSMEPHWGFPELLDVKLRLNVLAFAAWGGDVAVLKAIFSRREFVAEANQERYRDWNVVAKEDTPLTIAAAKGHVGAVEVLLGVVTKREAGGYSAAVKGAKRALEKAGINGHREVVRRLLMSEVTRGMFSAKEVLEAAERCGGAVMAGLPGMEGLGSASGSEGGNGLGSRSEPGTSVAGYMELKREEGCVGSHHHHHHHHHH